MKAWIFQDGKQIKKLGAIEAQRLVDARQLKPDDATDELVKSLGAKLTSWYVGWVDPNGKRKCKAYGPGSKGKMFAQKAAEQVTAKLLTGTYDDVSRSTWTAFRADYERKIIEKMEPGTRECTLQSLAHFERLIKPAKMQSITSGTIAEFVAKRRQEFGNRREVLPDGSIKRLPVSRATINKDLRHIRAAIRKAAKWDYVAKIPEFDFEKVTTKLPVYMTPDDFQKLYAVCGGAQFPAGLPNIVAADWWRGLLFMAYTTGWRISELLALKWSEVDLDAAQAVTKGETNKGRRDELVPLTPQLVDHLRTIKSFAANVFPWTYHRRTLYVQFQRLQQLARIKPNHADRAYGFHDLRRGFATMNAASMTANELQSLMRHKSPTTTRGYINQAEHVHRTAAKVFVPNLATPKPAVNL